MSNIISTLPQSLQTSFWTVQLLVNGYALVQLSHWMWDNDPDEPRLKCEICGNEATVSGEDEHDTVSCLGPPGDRHEESRTGIDYQVGGEIDVDIFARGAITAESARVQLNWWPQLSDPDWFEFHYI